MAPKKTAPKPAAKKAPAPKKAAPKPAAKKSPVPPKVDPKATKAAKAPAAPKAAAAPKPVSNGIYVKGWGQGDLETATKIFASAGKIVSAFIRRNKYALVFYENATSVKKAIDSFNGKEVAGTVVSVVTAKTTPKADKHKNSKVVFVSPLMRESTTRKAVYDFFRDCGKIVKLRMYHNNTAYVYFETAEAAQRAVSTKDNQEFHQHKLKVKISTRSLEADKKRAEKGALITDVKKWMKTAKRV